MAHPLRGSVAVAGIGMSGIGEAPGRSHLELTAEAAYKAIADAGLKKSDIDGLCSANTVNFMPAMTVAEYLGIQPSYINGTNLGGSSFLDHVIAGAAALKSGLCNAVLVCYGSNQRTAAGRLVTSSDGPPWEIAYQPRYPIIAYALAAARHMHEYGTTREQLAEVAVSARKWAQKNPIAFERGPLTIEDCLNSRMVCDPLTVRDCCLVTDGGGALVMVSADRAKDMPNKPAYFLGGGTATWHRAISEMPDLTVSCAADSGKRAFEMAGLKQSDVDVLELYDAFTINTILFLEDLGFCKKGEGGAFVEGGRIAPGGELPVNTNGGGLSCVHPGMYGMYTMIEAVEQIRGSAGERQIADTNVALAHGNGGTLSSQVTVLFGSEATL